MGDIFEEQLIKRETPLKYQFYKGALVLGVVAIALAGMLIPNGRILMPLAVIAAFGAYYVMQNWNLEYEYTFVNGELDIDKIMSQANRKRVISVDVKNLEIMALDQSHGLDGYRHGKYDEYDCTSLKAEPEYPVYVMIFQNEDGKKVKIRLEPNDKIVSAIKKMAPRKVIQY